MDEIKTGWLSPTGEWHPCPVYDHISVARRLSGEDRRADDVLISRGWVKISITQLGRREWRIYWDRHIGLSHEQKQFLEPYFAEDSEYPIDLLTKDYFEEEW